MAGRRGRPISKCVWRQHKECKHDTNGRRHYQDVCGGPTAQLRSSVPAPWGRLVTVEPTYSQALAPADFAFPRTPNGLHHWTTG